MTKTTKKTFMTGAAILGAAGLIVKIIGAVYRIPLSNNILHATGMGFYQTPYPIYVFLLALSSAGLPAAISRMVSYRVAKGDDRGAYQIYRVAMNLLIRLGIIAMVLIVVLAKPLEILLKKEPGTYMGFLALAPALLFVCMFSAYRGYFQGYQKMVPTAVSQIIEQFVKLIVGFPLAYFLMRFGPAMGAAGALIGVSVSEVAAFVYLRIEFARNRVDFSRQTSRFPAKSDSFVLWRLVRIALPMALGACMMPLVNMLDSVIVQWRLVSAGFPEKTAHDMFGILSGNVNTLASMPQVFTLAISMSLLPAIASAIAADDDFAFSNTIQKGFKMAILVGLPCCLGLFALADPIISTLYSSYPPEQIAVSVTALRNMAASILFLALVQASTSVLQGLGRQNIPLISLAIGIAVKALLNIILVSIPQLGVSGAAIATVVCYATAAAINIVMIVRHTEIHFDLLDIVGRPALASACMFYMVMVCGRLLGFLSKAPYMLVMMFIGVGSYALALLVCNVVRDAEMDMLPGGAKIKALLIRARLWRS